MTAYLYRPDVVDVHTLAWENFTAQLDLAQLELERVTTSRVSAEVAAHELAQERFGSRRHHEMLWRHRQVQARSRKRLADQDVPLAVAMRLREIADRAETRLGGFAKPLGDDSTPPSTTDTPTNQTTPVSGTRSHTRTKGKAA